MSKYTALACILVVIAAVGFQVGHSPGRQSAEPPSVRRYQCPADLHATGAGPCRYDADDNLTAVHYPGGWVTAE